MDRHHQGDKHESMRARLHATGPCAYTSHAHMQQPVPLHGSACQLIVNSLLDFALTRICRIAHWCHSPTAEPGNHPPYSVPESRAPNAAHAQQAHDTLHTCLWHAWALCAAQYSALACTCALRSKTAADIRPTCTGTYSTRSTIHAAYVTACQAAAAHAPCTKPCSAAVLQVHTPSATISTMANCY